MALRARLALLTAAVIASTIGVRGQVSAPQLVTADRHDLSPALRDLRPLPPQGGSVHEVKRVRRAHRQRSLDPIVQNSPAVPLVPAPSQSFDGLSNVNGVLPPDTNGDVGPNHYVEWVNLSFAIYSKGSPSSPPTLLYGPAGGNTLWTGFGGPCETTNNGDPVVRYDHLADRWFMSQFSMPNAIFGLLIGPFYQCVAVSATADPTGPYYRYQYTFSKLNDYPKFGVWPDAYYMAINQFSAVTLQWAGQGVLALDRDRMLLGQPANMIYFDLSAVDTNLGGMLPSDLDGPPPPAGSPNYFLQMDDDAWGYSPDQLQLWRFHVDWNNPAASSFTRSTTLPTAPFDADLCAGAEGCLAQPGTGAKLDTVSDRLMYRLQYRNLGTHESLVVNHTVDADGSDHAGIRWYEIRDPGATPSIYQQGTYAPDADHRWMASAAMDRVGNLAIGFSVTGATTFPSIRYAARLATDPPGTLAQGETDLVVGSGSQTSSTGRWGDYSMLVVDPTDDCTFWYSQQYYAVTSASGWRTRIGTFTLPSCTPAPTSPSVSIVATTATATEAGPANGQFTVTRSGDTMFPLTVFYTTGGSASPGDDYVPLPGAVTIDAGSSVGTITVAPIDDAQFESNESVIVTITPNTNYSIGTPGTAFVTIVSDDLPSDLVVTALTVPAAAGENVTISIADTTKNQGSGPSAASSTGFYLSKNLTLDGDDVWLGSRTVPSLAPGASNSATTPVTIPSGTVTGTYYVIAKADFGNLITESVETNNTKWSNSFGVGPDLIVSAITAPPNASAGATIAVNDTTTNQGGGTAGASTTSLYLSSNLSLEASDPLLGSRAVPSLAASATNSATTFVVIPAGTQPGTYYVLVRADSGAAVVESQEFNNVKYSLPIQIGADLTVTSISAPATAGAGTLVTVNETTKNQGGAAAPSTTTAFYLSANSLVDGDDIPIGARTVAALAAGASESASTPLTLPSNIATGSYYIIAKADANNDVTEANENNNTRLSGQVKVGPDLIVTATTAPAIGGAGGTISVGETIKNQGGGAAPASATGFYLSTTSSLNASAVFLGSRGASALPAGTTETGTVPVIVPANTATGTYYVVASVDFNNQIAETVETNNAGFGTAVRIGPDLTVTALTGTYSNPAGSTVTIGTTVLNQGGGNAPASTTKYYLSSNLTLDPGDKLIGAQSVGPLNGSTSASTSTPVTIPSGTTPGYYWLIAVADGDGTFVETSESNNTKTLAIQVTAGS